MTEKLRELDALDLMMQDHREVESLLSEFEYRKRNRQHTGRVIARACAELKMHDTLETSVLYAAVKEAAEDERTDRMVGDAEVEHDSILELVEKVELARADEQKRDAYFSELAARVKQHVAAEENERFPFLKALKRLDLDVVSAAMKKRRSTLMAAMNVTLCGER